MVDVQKYLIKKEGLLVTMVEYVNAVLASSHDYVKSTTKLQKTHITKDI